MDVLVELLPARQIAGESFRRWFTSDELDLIVWCDDAGAPVSFQLCYDKPTAERALTWKPGRGFLHMAVDDGEHQSLGFKATPILVADGRVDANRVSELFVAASSELPRDIVAFVDTTLRAHPDFIRSR